MFYPQSVTFSITQKIKHAKRLGGTEGRLLNMHYFFGILLLLVADHAAAEVPVERAVKYRQSAYYLMGQHMSQINAVIKGEMPYNKTLLEKNAEIVVMMGGVVIDAFPVGSDSGATKAMPEIWREMDKFKQLMHESQSELDKLLAAVKTGNMAAIEERFSEASKSCKKCHELYKTK